jgi:dolichol-phosphate mannosyltransferase
MANLEMILPAELSIIVPTFNESQNVALIADAVDRALPGVRWEMIYVDDNSPDGTAETVREMALKDPRIRVIRRHNRRGLATACVEGILSSAAPYAAVIDADLQHDEKVLRTMLERIRQDNVDLMVGSRYVEGGGVGDWDSRRVMVSKIATRMARRLTRTVLSDPMSGFFMVRRDAFLRSLPNLSSIGFKILLDIAASAPKPLRIEEVGYNFRPRERGTSKLDSLVAWEYLLLVIDKLVGRFIPTRFVSFALVGGFGIFVHLAALSFLYKGMGYAFEQAQLGALIIAISSNFFLNNALTYRDQRLHGAALIAGWTTFNLVSAVGAIGNIGAAEWLFTQHTGWVPSALAGAFVGVVWNYTTSALFTWRRW